MRNARRVVVTIIGVLVLGLGVLLMPLPGPGLIVVVLGLTILASEYAWARRLLVGARQKARQASLATVQSPLRTAGTIVFGLGMCALGGFLVATKPDLPVVSPTAAGWGILVGGLFVLGMTIYTLITERRRPRRDRPAVGRERQRVR